MDISEFWIYGDSLSTGTHGDNGYLDALCAGLGIGRLRNFAVGSSGLTVHTPNSMVSVLQKQAEDAKLLASSPDMILIWHGSNDWYWGSPVGNFEDGAEDSFCASVRWTVTVLRERYPSARLIWATPIFRLERPDGCEKEGDAFRTGNKIGKRMGDYTAALREASLLFQFPLIEMGQYVNIHMQSEGYYLEDHVHPNANGYRNISRVLIRKIREFWDYTL